MTRRVAARAVFDEHALDALAGNVRQLVLVDEGHLGVLLLRRIGEDPAERQGGEKQRTEAGRRPEALALLSLRIPAIATTCSDTSRPPVTIDRDQSGAGHAGAVRFIC